MVPIQADLRRRILRAFVGRGLIEKADAKEILGYQHSEPGSDKRGARADEQNLTPLELIARIYEVFSLLCPLCGGQMRLIAFITEGTQIRRIRNHIGVDSEPQASCKRFTPTD